MKKNKSMADRAVTFVAYLFVGVFGIICFYPLLLT